MNMILSWLSLAGSFVVAKALPMIILTAFGILLIRIAMKLVRKTLEKSKLEKAAHTLILTASQIALYILLALMVAPAVWTSI